MDEKREKKATVVAIENIIDEKLALGIIL